MVTSEGDSVGGYLVGLLLCFKNENTSRNINI